MLRGQTSWDRMAPGWGAAPVGRLPQQSRHLPPHSCERVSPVRMRSRPPQVTEHLRRELLAKTEKIAALEGDLVKVRLDGWETCGLAAGREGPSPFGPVQPIPRVMGCPRPGPLEWLICYPPEHYSTAPGPDRKLRLSHSSCWAACCDPGAPARPS